MYYFDVKSDGKGNYYIIIGALPKRDKGLRSSLKKEHLLYSKEAQSPTTIPNDSSVSTPASNKVGAEQDGLPSSDKASVPTSNIPQNQQERKGEGKESAADDKTAGQDGCADREDA